jgi:hypothetical protein
MLLKPAGLMASAAWPAQVSGCKLFCENFKSLVTGGYDSWINQASTSTVTQSTESLRPDQDADRFGSGNDGMSFDNSDDYMSVSPILTFVGDFSLFVVIYRATDADPDTIVSGAGTDLLFLQASGGRNNIRFWNGSSSVILSTSGSTPAGFKSLLEIHRDSSGDFEVINDGADITLGTPNDSTNMSVSRIGSSGSWPSSASVGAIAVYDTLVEGSLRTSIRSYFSSRWTT